MNETRVNLPTTSKHAIRRATWCCAVAFALIRFAPFAVASETIEGDAAERVPAIIEGKKGPVRVVVTAERDRVPMGEPFSLTIRIEAESGVEVMSPKFEGILGGFEVTEQTTESVDCDVALACRETKLTLSGPIPGTMSIPPMSFAFVDARPKLDGSNEIYQDAVETEALPITVELALADMKGPASLPIPWSLKLLWWGLGVLAVAILGGLVARWWLKRPKRLPQAMLVPQLPPYEWAMREMERLIADDLVERGQVQEFYFRINLLLRQYIERRFGFLAGEQTSEEFVRAVQSAEWFSAEQRAMLSAFVSACDPVKYAKQQPSAEETRWVLSEARRFIESTRPGITSAPATAGVAEAQA